MANRKMTCLIVALVAFLVIPFVLALLFVFYSVFIVS